MKTSLLPVAGIVVLMGLMAGASAAAMQSAPRSSTAEIIAAEAWAFPLRDTPDPSVAKVTQMSAPDARAAAHVMGSTQVYTRAQINPFNPPDWFPQDHPPMPQIVARGREPAFACAYCHMPDGESDPAGAPLAGLSKTYMLEQVAAFRTGARGSSAFPSIRAMVAQAHAVTDSDLHQAAEYFSKLRFVPRTRVIETLDVPGTHWDGFVLVPDKDATREPLGKRIVELPVHVPDYLVRDNRGGVVAYVPRGSVQRGAAIAVKGVNTAASCESCHGPGLQGQGDIPYLAGRSPTYIVRELILFRLGQRSNPGAGPMQVEAAQLTLQDMIDVAAYAASRKP